MTIPLVYVDEPLSVGATLRLSGRSWHYLGRVMRVKAEDVVRVSDGSGGIAPAKVAAVGSDWLEVVVGTVWTVPAPAVGVTMLVSPLKGKGLQPGLRVCSELGVDAVVLLPLERSISLVSGPKLERMQESVRESARRVGQPRICTVLAGLSLQAEIERRVDEQLFFFHEKDGGSLDEVLLDLNKPAAFVVGPEGGLAPGEVAQLRAAGAQGIRLQGPAFSAETAVGIAATLALHKAGRL
jgi:16S rRNA (uracil1498-N3)-methyltransferase